MKINFSKKRAIKSSKIKTKKFLFLPMFHNGSMYWLENVIVKKNFNGKYYQVTDIKRFK
ncbi:conserved protein of unknown function [Tenacibaculum sp. 190130A14a]|uniref:Uncharacterized protein n=1 Tax=Tenacibaculum polynesiense TaxID=3137857 RepID=A0ABM9PGB5_9FLAO